LTLPGSIQASFLDQIKLRLSPSISLADELAEVLNVSRDSAYRRIRGETTLSFDEIKTLSNRFQISVDSLLGNSTDLVTFSFRMINRETFPFDRWLGVILKSLETIAPYERKEISWMAKDIPITHYFQFPGLAAFKCYFWMKTILQYPEYAEKKYNERLLGEQLLAITAKIWAKYADTPCTEIWSFEVVQITLQQIEHYMDCGLFEKKEDAVKVCEEYLLFINHLEKEVELGYKFNLHTPGKRGAPYKVYYNDIIIGDNTVLFTMDDACFTYITANTFNLLSTSNPFFCGQTKDYFSNIISRSALISGTSEKERSKIFNKFRTGIEKLLMRIRNAG
jgi:transcriptional regulator with XRE-family HTH domain